MSVSRSLGLFRSATRLLTAQKSTLLQQVRHSGGGEVWCYRTTKPPPAPGNPDFKFLILAELAGGFMWWWILWHFYHDYGHVIGEWEYPDPEKWTDEELGVPKTLLK